jgi:lipopolysaccharide/colanic/teichoic acid biosynthesis glycosyltransferase
MKRVFDLTLIFIGLPLLLPVLAAVAILIRTKLGSPILFSQVRPGKDGQSFKMIKFRTMSDECGFAWETDRDLLSLPIGDHVDEQDIQKLITLLTD